MDRIRLADAKTHLREPVDGADAGEAVGGKPIDPLGLRALTDAMSAQPGDAGTFVRAMREGDRY